jgi:uncharacterized membrane protein YdjX (TVP38/TMEM64 family)
MLDVGGRSVPMTLMRGVLDFINRMDATAWRAVGVTVSLFAGVAIVLVLGKTGAFGTFDEFERNLETLRGSAWGLPALAAVFCAAAFIGAPQFGLIAAAVVAFGPSLGFFYSWVATLVSGTVTFWLGRFAGEETFRRYAGDTANRLSEFIGRNAFVASAVVRNVPTAPFIVVNMAFGVSQARFLHYLGGMAIGIIPKVAIVTFFGGSVMAALKGSPWVAIGAALAAALGWIALMLFARIRVRRGRRAAGRQQVSPERENLSPSAE